MKSAAAAALTARKRNEVKVFMFAVALRSLERLFLRGGESEEFLPRKFHRGRQPHGTTQPDSTPDGVLADHWSSFSTACRFGSKDVTPTVRMENRMNH